MGLFLLCKEEEEEEEEKDEKLPQGFRCRKYVASLLQWRQASNQ